MLLKAVGIIVILLVLMVPVQVLRKVVIFNVLLKLIGGVGIGRCTYLPSDRRRK